MSHHATGSTLVEIKIEGEKKPVNAMIRELQTSPIKGTIMHVDFLAVSLDALITPSSRCASQAIRPASRPAAC